MTEQKASSAMVEETTPADTSPTPDGKKPRDKKAMAKY
jgi:hypothetical protein